MEEITAVNSNHYSRVSGGLFLVLVGLRLLLVLSDITAALLVLNAPHLYDQFGRLFDGFFRLGFWISWPGYLVFGVWLFQYHRDLGRVFPGYPITPWGAIARFFIPFYHYWGVWNTGQTAQSYFDEQGSPQPWLTLRSATILFYIGWAFLPGLSRIPAVNEWAWFYSVHALAEIGSYLGLFWSATRSLQMLQPQPVEPVAAS